MTNPKKLLALVDGSYYLFRAYHAMPGLTNSQKEPTGAIFGVINMLRKLLKEEQPDYFAVVFDAKGKSFRNDLYPEYKANRPPAPPDLVAQIEPLHEIIRALGVPLLLIDNVEADDVIATLAARAAGAGLQTLVSTGDKDLAQIVNDDIHLINTMNNTRFDRAGVIEKYGVPPERIVDYLALIGDTSDNVPGIPKVGPKTAVKWLAEHGSLDEIVARADSFPGKVGEYLRENLDQIPLSKELVTLKTDLELPVEPKRLLIADQDKVALREHYRRWGFRSWLPDVNGAGRAAPETPVPAQEQETSAGLQDEQDVETTEEKYETVLTVEHLERWVDKLAGAEIFAFDTETTSLDYMRAELVGLSFSVRPGEAAYVPVAHDYDGAPKQISRRKVLEKLRPLLESDTPRVVGQNLKYDRNVLANYRVGLNGIAHDSMLQSYVLDSVGTRHDMTSLARKYLDKTVTSYEDVAGKGAKQVSFNQVPVEQAAAYAAADADITLRLHRTLWPKLAAQPGLRELYTRMEMPLLDVIARMERNGVLVDKEMLKRQSDELKEQMQQVEQQAHRLAGQSFNIGSPKQIQEVLYEKMQLPVTARTPTGQPSTAESVLQELAAEHELPALILRHREFSKLKSTYTDRLPEQVNQDSGRVHTSYHQAVAATGRLSSSDPNLQNIPIRTEEGRKIRRAFIASPGNVLLAADYSQIELRIMAHLSADAALLAAFAAGSDIHRATAAEVFGASMAEVSPEQRRAAKAINFGLIYGMSAFGLARQLGIDRGSARRYVDKYFERYPGVKEYMDATRIRARETGYVETVFKRRLYLPDIAARNAARRQYAERTAINAPMQGTAADIIKRAMIEIDKKLLRSGKNIRMIMQVHDELVFEVAEAEVVEYAREIRNLMSGAAGLSVPLIVDIGTGANWDEAH
ncbi:MAG: DNA polymerase I [Gammaproteobacteria bacterium]|nr:DNA polymerase I [Gammaproteobacteria bacterium]